MLTSILKTLIIGRPDGFRRSILKRWTTSPEDTSPNSSYSSPSNTTNAPVHDSTKGVIVGGAVKMEPPKDVTPPEGFEVVLHKDSLQDGDIVEVIIAGTSIAVVQLDGVVYAMASTCPHAGGPLAEGSIHTVGGKKVLRCPYHGWDFDVQNGACQTSSQFDVGCYATHVEGDAICVKL